MFKTSPEAESNLDFLQRNTIREFAGEDFSTKTNFLSGQKANGIPNKFC